MKKEWLIVGMTDFDNTKCTAIKNQTFVKPNGGLWASPYTPDDEYKSEWHRFVSEEMQDKNSENGMVFDFKEESRIYTIDTQEDLINLLNTYGYIDSGYSSLFPDFERISKHFDVLHLTERGQWATRLPTKNSKYNLYGWDVECCLILNADVIKDCSYVKL